MPPWIGAPLPRVSTMRQGATPTKGSGGVGTPSIARGSASRSFSIAIDWGDTQNGATGQLGSSVGALRKESCAVPILEQRRIDTAIDTRRADIIPPLTLKSCYLEAEDSSFDRRALSASSSTSFSFTIS